MTEILGPNSGPEGPSADECVHEFGYLSPNVIWATIASYREFWWGHLAPVRGRRTPDREGSGPSRGCLRTSVFDAVFHEPQG